MGNDKAVHSPLPWRSVYPLGSKHRCAAIQAGDHYVYLHVFKPDDVLETIRMHQANADLIVTAVNSMASVSNQPAVVPERWRGVDVALDTGEAMDAHFHSALEELGAAEAQIRELAQALQELADFAEPFICIVGEPDELINAREALATPDPLYGFGHLSRASKGG